MNLGDATTQDARWYVDDPNDTSAEDEANAPAARMVNEVRRLRNNQLARREMYRFFLEQYSVSESVQLGLTAFESSMTFAAPTMPFNAIRRGVNTVFAKCAKNKPLPMVLANRGDYKIHKRARGLTNFLAGLFNWLKVPNEVAAPVCKSAEVFGTGIAHVYSNPDSEFPEIDVIFPWEFLVPTAEARAGKPKTFYLTRWVDVEILVGMYPECEEDIRAAVGRDTDDTWADAADTHNLILVYYGWRVATSKKKKGKWLIAVSGGKELDSGEYEREYPPFAVLRYNRPIIGYYGEGLAAEMTGFQYELNFTTETLRMSHRTAPTGVWLVDDNCGVPDAHYSNDIGYVLKKRPGAQVQYFNPTPAPPQTYEWHNMVAEGALKWTGISTMSANAEKPPGINSGVALNTLDDIEADNFAVFQSDYEQFHIDLSNLLIDEMKEIAKRNPNTAILVQDKRSAIEVAWNDVDMARDAILMQTFPVALLGRTPAARREMVAGLFKDGIIDRALYLKLLDAPDIDAEVDLDAATRTLLDEQIEHILDAEDTEAEGAYVHPYPYTDLVYGLRRATQQLCLGTLQKRPDENLSLLRQYIEEMTVMLKRQHAEEAEMQPQQPGAGAPPGGMPPGMPPGPAPGMGPTGAMAPPPPPNAVPPPPGAQGGIIQ